MIFCVTRLAFALSHYPDAWLGNGNEWRTRKEEQGRREEEGEEKERRKGRGKERKRGRRELLREGGICKEEEEGTHLRRDEGRRKRDGWVEGRRERQ